MISVAIAAIFERVAPSVQQPHGHVAAVGVGAKEEARFPGRPDRHALRGDDIDLFAANAHGFGDVIVVGARVGDVFGVHRREQAQHDDHPKQGTKRGRDLVAREHLHEIIIASTLVGALAVAAPSRLQHMALGPYLSSSELQSLPYTGWKIAALKLMRLERNLGASS